VDTSVAISLLPALLEKSLAIFVLAVLLAAALWAIYKLWLRGNAREITHAAELAALNTLRLEETKEYAARSKESSDYLRSMVDMQTRLLSRIEQDGKTEEKSRTLLLAIGEALKIPLKDFV
jgi:hypothetical protein